MRDKFDILVVDDEPVVVSAAEKFLSHEGYKIDTAPDAETGIDKLYSADYRLILSDLMLPQIDGLKFMENIKHEFPQIPVVMITGYATLENAIRSFKLGAFDFIPKPFDVEELLAVVYRGLHFFERGDSIRALPFPTKNLEHESIHYFLGEHAVAMFNGGTATVTVGLTFPNLMGPIKKLELPSKNSSVLQGNTCAKIIAGENMVHRVWTPLSGRVMDVNEQLITNVNLINTDPFDRGWLMKLVPTYPDSELANLTAEAETSLK